MGYGFPAGIGAQAAFPDKLVVTIAGDGSIQMNIQELATAVMEKLPVKVIILNNYHLGMVRQWQQLFYKHNYSGVILKRENPENGEHPYVPDFVKLCEAYGAVGLRVTEKAKLRETLEEAMKNGQPTFVECIVEEEENVWPMIPAGCSVEQMISGLA
jgi:acetolactate synthase-1/2/3 large subunit